MIISVGIDICNIQRMEKALLRHGDFFLKRILSERECANLGPRVRDPKAVAASFAVKEAYSKCVDGAKGVPWHAVEVIRNESGRPTLELKEEALQRIHLAGAFKWHISISHDAGVAIALCILES